MKEITRRTLALFLSLVMALDMVMPVWAEETLVPELPVTFIADDCLDDDCNGCNHEHHHDDEIKEGESKEVTNQETKVEETKEVEPEEEVKLDEVKEPEKEMGLLEKIGEGIVNVIDEVKEEVKNIVNALTKTDDKDDDLENDSEITGEVVEILDKEIPEALAAFTAPMLKSALPPAKDASLEVKEKDTSWAVKEVDGHTYSPNLDDCTATVTCTCSHRKQKDKRTHQYFETHEYPEGTCGEKVECTRCNQTKTYEHVYTNSYEPDTDTQHLKYCDICKKAVKENHKFGSAQKYDCTKHKLVCQDCRYVKYVDHTMVDHYTGYSINRRVDYRYCSECGAKTTDNNFHNYEFDVNGTITYDSHTLKCTGCGLTKTEEHTGLNDVYYDNGFFGFGGHWVIPEPSECSVCGVHQYCNELPDGDAATHRFVVNNSDCTQTVYCLATLNDPHSDDYCSEPDKTFNRGSHEYVYSNKTKTTHDKSCNYCTIDKITESHVYDQKNGTECICGYKKPACDHIWEYEKYNETQHKYICSNDCGADGYENHTWDDGVITTSPTCITPGVKTYTCKCGETKTETVRALGHDETNVGKVDSTCTESGHEAGVFCTGCATWLSGHEEIAPKGHDVIVDEAVLADCTHTGLTEGSHCDRCNAILVAQTETQALGHLHEDANWVEVKAATCTEKGKEKNLCSRCGEKDITYRDIETLGHNEVHHEAKAATCTEIGWDAYVTCSRCDYTTYKENKALGHEASQECIDEKSIVPSTCTVKGHHDVITTCVRCQEELSRRQVEDDLAAHKEGEAHEEDIVEPKCTQDGSYNWVVRCTECKKVLSSKPKTIEALGHDWEEITLVPATCTHYGLSAYKKCKACDAEEGKTVIPATGHKMVEDESVTSTYEETKNGHIRHFTKKCENEGCTHTESASEELEHNWDNGVVTTEPTCTEEGVMTYTCDKCKATKTETIKAKGHDLEHHAAKAATCTEIGWDEYDTCSRCDYTTYKEIPATNHAWDNGEVTTAPTCTEEGVRTFHCVNQGCNETRTEKIDIDKDNHKASEEDTDRSSIVSSTCTEKGHHDVITVCVRCKKELSRKQVEDDLVPHVRGEEHEEDRVEATCTTDGSYNMVVRCTECNTVLSSTPHTIEATGHTWDNGVITLEPTCTKEGVRTFHCTIPGCNGTKDETVAINPNNHTVVIDAAKVATCTTDGLTLGKHCSECETVLLAQDIVPALGHAWDNGKVTIEATCTEEGNTHYECNACHITKDEPIEKLDHKWYVYESKYTPNELMDYNDKEYSHVRSDYFKCEDCEMVSSQHTDKIEKCTPSEIVIENIKDATATEAGSHDEVKYCTECKQEVYRITVEDKLGLNVLDAIAKETFEKTYDENNKVLFDGEESKVITVKDDKQNDVKVKVTGTYDDSLPGDRKVTLVVEVISDEANVFPRYVVTDIEGKINPIKIYAKFDDIQLPNNMTDKAQVVKEIDKVIKPFDTDVKEVVESLNNKDNITIKDANYEVAPCEKYGVKHQAQVVLDATVKDSEGNEVVIVRKIIDGNVIYNYKSNKKKKKTDDEVVELDDELIARGLDFEYIDLPKNIETPSDWAKADVYDLTEKGIVNGYEDMTYRPNNLIRRDEFSKLAYMVLSLKENEDGKSKDFEDTADNWAREMIRIATTVDVLRGYDDVTFGPADNITNEQMMAILVRGMKYLGKDIRVTNEKEADKELAKVIDGDQVSDWAKLDAATAIKYGLFIGDENKAVKPLGNTTRAQVAVILVRYMNLISELIK